MSQESLASPQIASKFREERFIESDPDRISLLKIGEYVRTPLYEPSIRGMWLSLSDARKRLNADKETNKKLKEAWKAATKIFETRAEFFKAKYHGPAEYCIALICFTLDEPFKIYQDFNKLCQDLMTNTFCYFPYQGLFYLLIQAEMRLRFNYDHEGDMIKRIKGTPGTDLDYNIQEVPEEDEGETLSTPRYDNPIIRKFHSTSPVKVRNIHRVYLGFAFRVSETTFQPRTLVAFSHIMPTTLDGMRLIKLLGEKKKPATLIEIDHVSWSSRYIGPLSVFPVEKEVVIWPWIKFYVDERKMISENVEKIILKPTSRSFVRTAAEVEKELF